MHSTRLPFPSVDRRSNVPGWPETIVALVVVVAVDYGVGSQLHRLPLGTSVIGLLFAGLSGVEGLAGFGAAVLRRIRAVAPFGVRRTSFRWLAIAIVVGLAALVGKVLLNVAVGRLAPATTHVQDVYAAGARGGALHLVLATLLLGVLTPVGEELLFRGVVTIALLRYGPLVGVVGGACIFAMVHGPNLVLPVALLEGLFAGEVFRRSDSIWTAIVVHMTYNLPTVPLMVLTASA